MNSTANIGQSWLVELKFSNRAYDGGLVKGSILGSEPYLGNRNHKNCSRFKRY
jgi:hypothetical protein